MTPGLIERLEAAGEGSRELDYAIKHWLEINTEDEYWKLRVAADWTTSLDAALALASRVLDSKSALHLLADLLSYEAAQSDFDLIKTDDLPRLLCIAILKARATQEQG